MMLMAYELPENAAIMVYVPIGIVQRLNLKIKAKSLQIRTWIQSKERRLNLKNRQKEALWNRPW